MGPTLIISDQIHSEKYRGDQETFRDAVNRIADGMSSNSEHFYRLKDILSDMSFLPAGRIQAAVGSLRKVTAGNCYVSCTIEDSMQGIMSALSQTAQTLRMGGGWGGNYSTLRPKNDIITTLGSSSSGPVSFMEVWNALCGTIKSAGHRRGAMMGVFSCDHPDIIDFLQAKTTPPEVKALWDLVDSLPDPSAREAILRSVPNLEVREQLATFLPDSAQIQALRASLQNTLKLTNFNVSIAVTDAFMQAVEADDDFKLKFNGRVYRTVRAKDLWSRIMRNTWDYAEPGILFIDRINEMNNLWYCEEIQATNPCGEQPLPPYGVCILGSFNLVRYVVRRNGVLVFDFDKLKSDVRPVVEGMDNVIEEALYPLPEQKDEELNKRRMGLGVTGVANALEALGFPYGSPEFVSTLNTILETIRDAAYNASCDLAEERGAFALFNKEKYLQSGFIKTLPKSIRSRIAKHGIRNSHLLSIAPTGTISFAADNVSSSIEPVWQYEYNRKTYMADGTQEVFRMQDYGYARFGVKGKTTPECTIDDHLAVLEVATRNVDSAVSKTCNCGPDMTFAEFEEVYTRAWKFGAKGCTTFRLEGKREGILSVEEKKEEIAVVEDSGEACYVDPQSGVRICGD